VEFQHFSKAEPKLKLFKNGGKEMNILNELIGGTDNKSSDIVFMILILGLVLGSGKNKGFNLLNLFNNSDVGSSSHHHKHKRNSCSSSSG
jgi:hypothetical protein